MKTTARTMSSSRAAFARSPSASSAIARSGGSIQTRSRARSPSWMPAAEVAADRDQVRQQRVGRLRQAAAALHHGNLAQQIRVKDDRILLALEAGQQIVVRQLLRRDARAD